MTAPEDFGPRLVTDNDAPYNGEAEYLTGIAFLRLAFLLKKGFQTFMAAHQEKPELTVSRHLALSLARECPAVLDAIRGSK